MNLLTRKEAAELLGMSLPTLDLERTTGRLAYIQRKPQQKRRNREGRKHT